MTGGRADVAADHTAVRCALWRAMHVQVDAPPHVLTDEIGLRIADPGDDWRERPDMDPVATRAFRAAMVARARFVEDLVAGQAAEHGVDQYVLLGAGLDTFAQRGTGGVSGLRVFEVDRPGPQEWKRRRLAALGYGDRGSRPYLVPVDFEASGGAWREPLTAAGFDPGRPAVVASSGVTMYLTKEATVTTLRQVAALAPGSTLAMTFLLPEDLVAEADRPGLRASTAGARSSGTPFRSLYTPEEMLALAREAGFEEARHVSGASLAERYFTGRPDGLRPSTGEDLLVATT
ncbi:class I SAM-dependent methyltransferase [Streptomyces monashensis]|uniref:class I SAM-dependent methyltransferase n=1 Tax=Streptomyces monashensis TaxID=1678012 RepID=UPI0033ED2D44